MEECIFCKIVNKEIPARILYEDEEVVAFADAAPQAPAHVLVISRRHIASAEDLEAKDAELVGLMVLTAQRLARDLGVAAGGYRLVVNVGREGGQLVPHLHLHVLGGRPLAPSLG